MWKIQNLKGLFPVKARAVGRSLLEYITNLCNLDRYSSLSWSQEGEDMILRRIFEGCETGFFVDVGAHHPSRFSNTKYFYLKGWSGVNIDCSPSFKKNFEAHRTRDVNVAIAVGKATGEVQYFQFDESAVNSTSPDFVEKLGGTGFFPRSNAKINQDTLANILNKFASYKAIDFMDIDVEGSDLDVLTSNDWERFRPKIIVVEIGCESIVDVFDNPTYIYLKEKKYKLICGTVRSFFFRDMLN